MFQSSIPRFRKDQEGSREVYAVMLGKKQTPGPAEYITNKTVNYRSPFRHPRTDHLCFTSGKNRFNTTEIFHGQKYNRNPGPGDYETLKRSKSLPGAAKTRSQRFSNGATKDVG